MTTPLVAAITPYAVRLSPAAVVASGSTMRPWKYTTALSEVIAHSRSMRPSRSTTP